MKRSRDVAPSPRRRSGLRGAAGGMALGIGLAFIIIGVIEVAADVASGGGRFLYWFSSLCMGGLLILVGRFKLEGQRGMSIAAVTVGALSGAVATLWTIIGPILALAVVTLHVLDLNFERRREALRRRLEGRDHG